MNFLSHYYFDRKSADPNLVTGIVLPDLVKNADKSWALHPYKYASLLGDDPAAHSLLNGWMRHLEVDRHFHSSAFFTRHTQQLRALIAPLLEGSDVRPSFLAHVALELMLDGLLITRSLVDPHHFYIHLKNADTGAIDRFLRASRLTDTSLFFSFFDRFISSAYLHSYSETHQIVYALNSICERIWHDPLDELQKHALTLILLEYLNVLQESFGEIFAEIEEKL
jgi:hypothetical protein